MSAYGNGVPRGRRGKSCHDVDTGVSCHDVDTGVSCHDVDIGVSCHDVDIGVSCRDVAPTAHDRPTAYDPALGA